MVVDVFGLATVCGTHRAEFGGCHISFQSSDRTVSVCYGRVQVLAVDSGWITYGKAHGGKLKIDRRHPMNWRAVVFGELNRVGWAIADV